MENTNQKELRILTLFTQRIVHLFCMYCTEPINIFSLLDYFSPYFPRYPIRWTNFQTTSVNFLVYLLSCCVFFCRFWYWAHPCQFGKRKSTYQKISIHCLIALSATYKVIRQDSNSWRVKPFKKYKVNKCD